MNIKDYLQGLFTYQFSEANMLSILLKRGILEDANYVDVEEKSRELAQADLYMVMYTMYTQGSETVKKGNWSKSTGGINVGVYDRRSFNQAADSIYNKYGETISYSLIARSNAW